MRKATIDWLGITKQALSVVGNPIATNADICHAAGIIAAARGVHLTKTWRVTVGTTLKNNEAFRKHAHGVWGFS